MKVKTFRANTMVEALAKAKREFGAEAVILNTRTVKKGGVLGIAGRDSVEITAAKDQSDLPPAVAPGTIPPRYGRDPRADGAASRVTPTAQSVPVQDDALRSLRLEVGELKSIVRDFLTETRQSRVPNVPEKLLDTYQRLVERRVADNLARNLVARVHRNLGDHRIGDAKAVRGELANALRLMLPTSGPIRLDGAAVGGKRSGGPTIIALIGPTGVGKTTTVAKLAANFRLVEQRDVGLITLDTYRIGAIEQLKTYANILDVPLDIAATPDQLKSAIARMSKLDVVFIDTAGRSPRDAPRIEELTAFFQVVRPHETHLVLSGASGDAELKDAIDRFAPVGVDRVILTKLDEAVGFGVVLACLRRANAALSYVTTGQDVPHDIALAESDVLARRLYADDASELNKHRVSLADAKAESSVQATGVGA